ncbi:hypothetical protein BASA81_011093 [Batrachochytrium salamandrivorans]|nr:hypothetical protein BASA81_011093 [Batrachochytrium salamandrivorans]
MSNPLQPLPEDQAVTDFDIEESPRLAPLSSTASPHLQPLSLHRRSSLDRGQEEDMVPSLAAPMHDSSQELAGEVVTAAPSAPVFEFDENTGGYKRSTEDTTNRLNRHRSSSVAFIEVPQFSSPRLEPMTTTSEDSSNMLRQAIFEAIYSSKDADNASQSSLHTVDDDHHGHLSLEEELAAQAEAQQRWDEATYFERMQLTMWSWVYKFRRDFVPESIWVILTLLGGTMSVIAWLVDEITEHLVEIRNNIVQLPTVGGDEHRSDLGQWLNAQNNATSFFLYWTWISFWGLLAVGIVKYIAPQAAGSGIEQVRSIMTGYSIPGYLSSNTLIAKTLGLIAVQASGLKIGKEGPFVHIACSLGNFFLMLPWFKELKENRALTKQVISAACASGIASTFGSPVGGVLFAIEVTSNVYHTSDYWKAFYTAVFGELIFRFLSYFGSARSSQISLFPTTFSAQPYSLIEIPLYVIISTVCGFYGGFFVKLILGIRTWRADTSLKAVQYRNTKKHQQLQDEDEEGSMMQSTGESSKVWLILNDWWMQIAYYLLRPWAWAFFVLTLHCLFSFTSGQFMMRSLYAGIADFVVSGEMAQDEILKLSPDHRIQSTDWGNPSLLINLVLYWFINSFLFAMALSLPVPSGTLIPMLAIGLSMGRFFGEICQLINKDFVPGGYALVGASAFLAGATGAISTAVVVFEITAQLSFMVPILLSVIIGRACGKVISPDLYEALQITKNLPNIPPLSRQSSYAIPAKDLMDVNHIPYLPRYCSLPRIQQLLNGPSHRHDNEVNEDDLFAIATNDQERHYLVSVSRTQLKLALVSAEEASALAAGDEDRVGALLDLFSAVSTDIMSPACPHITPAVDVLHMFELSLATTMFVTDNCRIVGWLDLASIKHKIEHQHL